jgi:hypothetical protein
MKSAKLTLVIVFSFITLGCTKGVPGFSTLDSSNLPQPLFSGATEETITASSPLQTFAISGDCDSRITDIAGSAEGTAKTFSTLGAMAVSSVSIDCSASGHFSFTLKSLADLGFSPDSGLTYNVDLRAITNGGISNASVIHITYSPGAGPDPKHILLTGGSTASSSGERVALGSGIKATLRVSTRAPASSDHSVADAMTTKTGTHIIMKMGPAAQ